MPNAGFHASRAPASLVGAASLALALTFGGAPGCIRIQEQAPEQLRERALASVAAEEAPALVVATVDGDALVVEAAGTAALSEGRPVTEDSVFLWFSITKLFTATAIMQLHERGALDIDAPARDVLGAELAVHERRGHAITARQLMSHSSGLGNPSVWDRARPAGQPRPSLEDQLASLFADHGRRLRYIPGASEHYSNLGYLALGRMVELADPEGRDYETYVREEILEVLGMERTDFHWRPDMLEDAAIGHSRKGDFYTRLARRVANPEVFGEPLPEWETTVHIEVDGAPYGGLIGPAGDLAKFVGAHLNYGSWEGRQILSPASVAQMQTPMDTSWGLPLEHALGWHTDTIEGERYFNHMGKGGGYRPAVRIWPGRRYGVVILTNRTRYDPRPLTRTVPPL